jgi:HD-GYP domain-containing protein (c-di-GMP phosphodiesterase class II)
VIAIFGDMRDGPSPAVEELLEDFDSSSPAALSRRERRVELAGACLFLAVTGALALLLPGQRSLDLPLALALVAGYAAVSRIRFAVGYGFTAPTQLLFVPMLFLLPVGVVPLLVLCADLLAKLPDFLAGKTHRSRLLLSVGDAWHAVGPALVLGAAGVASPDLAQWPILLAALGAQLTFDFVGSTVREWLWFGISPKLQLDLFGWLAAVDVLLSPVGLLAAMASASAPGTVLLVLPLAGLLAIFARERSARLTQAVELSRAYRGTTLLLSDVLDADDEYTGSHSRDVVSLSVAVADALGLDSRERRNVEFGALLHDVGKISVPKEIINKPGPLTDDEWLVIKAHTIEGQRMLDQVGGLLSEVGRIVRSSHERWDGTGYPDGLAGEDIPRGAAIVSCCDAFSAMTTDRSYRSAMSTSEALAELRAQSGTQFDPAVVTALSRIIERSAVRVPEPSAALGRSTSGVRAPAVPALSGAALSRPPAPPGG